MALLIRGHDSYGGMTFITSYWTGPIFVSISRFCRPLICTSSSRHRNLHVVCSRGIYSNIFVALATSLTGLVIIDRSIEVTLMLFK
jgi:hypothetical protein